MGRWDRNPFPYPLIQAEEGWSQPLKLEGYEYDWKDNAPTHERLYLHNTMASIRQNRRLRGPCVPRDSLDIMLTSVYDHSRDSFLTKEFVFLQPDTIGLSSFRLLRNSRYIPDVVPARDLRLAEDHFTAPDCKLPQPGCRYFGLRVGGVQEKKSVYSVKLGISSTHSATTNPGYSRKVDGTTFAS